MAVVHSKSNIGRDDSESYGWDFQDNSSNIRNLLFCYCLLGKLDWEKTRGVKVLHACPTTGVLELFSWVLLSPLWSPPIKDENFAPSVFDNGGRMENSNQSRITWYPNSLNYWWLSWAFTVTLPAVMWKMDSRWKRGCLVSRLLAGTWKSSNERWRFFN